MAINPFSTGQSQMPTGKSQGVPYYANMQNIPTSNQYMTGQQQQVYDQQLMGNEGFAEMVRAAAELRKKKSLASMLRQQESQYSALGKKLPELQDMQQKMKMQSAELKLKQMRLDYLTKQSESAANAQQGQA